MKKISLAAIDPFFEKLGKLTKVQRLLICFGTLLVIIGGFVYLSYMPKFKKIDVINKKYKEVKKELAAAKKRAKRLNYLKQQMKKAEAKFKVVMKALPEKKEIPSLLASISQSGRDTGLEFLLFKPKAEVSKGFYVEIPLSIQVEGNYHNVALFFDKVGRLSRIVNIENIKMATKKGKTAQTLNTSCTAVTYKFLEASPKKAPQKGKKKTKRSKRRH